MKVIVTSGATTEHLDSVRVLTNISTGKLGAKIAEKFLAEGHEVVYVSSETTVRPLWLSEMIGEGDTGYPLSYRLITNVDSLMKVMEEEVPKADVVIHSAAVSDFTFDLSTPVKVGSSSTEDFVRYIQSTVRKTPKVISNFRTWNKNAILVGFKFTVGKTFSELYDIARELLEKNDLDFVFANDKEEMKRNKQHLGSLLCKNGSALHWNTTTKFCYGKEDIAKVIYENVLLLYNKRNDINKEI